MIRILLIARYRDVTMNRKVEWLARQSDLTIWHVCPQYWKDELVEIEQSSSSTENFKRIALPMIGSPSDPHRAMFRTLTFGIKKLKPQIIHAEEEPDSLTALQIAAARRLFAPKAKLILYTWQNINRTRSTLVRAIMRTTLNASDAVLAANQEAVKVLRELHYTKIVEVLPAVGVDTQTFLPRRSVKDDTFTVGYVGRFVIEKGIDNLIEAIAQIRSGVPNIRLIIVGDGPYRSQLETHARTRLVTDIVQFAGAMPPIRIADQLQNIDALVLPSHTSTKPIWKEQFGRILIEAMACKVPVIGSDSGAIPEVIGDAGLIFPEGDVNALADRLQRLIDSPELRQDLAERGYTRAMEHYTQERIAARTAEFYRKILA